MIRVLTVPARHPYVDSVLPAEAIPVAPDRVGGWEPDPVFETAPDADVVHVHFGFDHVEPAQLRTWARGLPLVVTVHDLRNPHHATRERHDAQLRALLTHADEVITLTPGAAAEIQCRFGRVARVSPHPAIYSGPSWPAEDGLVGIALKALRRNVVEPNALVVAAARGAASAGGRLLVTAHDATHVAGLSQLPATTVEVHDRLDDDGHRAYVSRLHVSVLPNRWGTHSGWLEACRDVGTAVVAPSCGFYAEQWSAVRTYGWDEHRSLDAASLERAVADALREPPPVPVSQALRDEQQAQARALHREVYERVARRAAA